jgi:hypothetical protein
MTTEFHHTLSPILAKVSHLAIIKVNKRLKLGLWGIQIPLKELFVDDTQINQTLTKLLQTLVNYCIVEAMNELGVNGRAVGADGYDYIINVGDVEFKVEFKLIAGTDSMKASFATGNKISANKDVDGNSVGKKSPLLWSIKYVMGDENQITDYAAALTNGERFFNEISGWKAGSGKNDSYANMQIAKDEILCVDVLYGKLHKANKWYHFLPQSFNA